MFFRRIAVTVMLLLPLFASLAARASSPSVVIAEVQTGTATSASQEFVSLYNPTSAEVSLAKWTLEYKSATGTTWSKRATLAGSIKSYGYYLIAPSTLSQADTNLSAGLAGTGGHVRIKDEGSNQVDLIGWGNAIAAETAPAPAPAAGQSLERLPGRLAISTGNSTDTDDNSKDLIINTAPTPRSTAAPIEVPAGIEQIASQPDPVDDTPAAQVVYMSIEITELLPNPASPLADDHDEFIELHNPNDQGVELHGYVLRSGSNFHDFYVLPNQVLAPGAYTAIYASKSHLSLTNTGGAAELLDPLGQVVSQADPYPVASPGYSWSRFDGEWDWTLQSTPATINQYVPPLVPVVVLAESATQIASESSTATELASTIPAQPSLAKVATKSAKKSSKPKAAPKSKIRRAASPKSSKITTVKSAPRAIAASSSPGSDSTKLLLGALGLTISYAIYEFRYDIQNFYQFARRKFGAR